MIKEQIVAPTEKHACMLRDERVKVFSFDDPIPHAVFDKGAAPGAGLSKTDKKTHTHSAELCRRKDRALARDITSTIEVRVERRAWLRKCENSGIKLIKLLFKKASEIGPSANTALSTILNKLVVEILQEPRPPRTRTPDPDPYRP